MHAKADEFAQTMTLEIGKTLLQEAITLPACAVWRYLVVQQCSVGDAIDSLLITTRSVANDEKMVV